MVTGFIKIITDRLHLLRIFPELDGWMALHILYHRPYIVSDEVSVSISCIN